MGKERLFTIDFILLSAIGFFYTANFLLAYICIPSFVEDEFGGNATYGGLVACIFVLGSFLSRIFLARFVDVIGKKKVLIITSLAAFLISLLYFVVPNIGSLILIRIAHGSMYGLGLLVVNSYIADIVPSSRRSEGIGYFMLAYTFASAIGPYLCIHFMHNGGYTILFAVSAVMLIIPFFLAPLLSAKPKIYTKEERANIGKLSVGNLIEHSAIKISLVVMIFYFAYSSVLTFVSEYGESIGLIEATSYFFVMIAVATFISRVFVGKLADTHGENIVLIPCFLLFILGLLLLGGASNSIMLLVSAFFIGFGVALVNSIGQSIVIRQSKPERYSICMSTFQIFMDVSYGFGPFVIGVLITMFGYSDTYYIAAVIGMISMVMYIALHGIGQMRLQVTRVH